jgi:lipoprotein NlpD
MWYARWTGGKIFSVYRFIVVGLLVLNVFSCSSLRVNVGKVEAVKDTQSECSSTEGYLVRKKDTLKRISRRCDIHFRSLVMLNRLSPPYIIYPGQRLLLPNGSSLSTIKDYYYVEYKPDQEQEKIEQKEQEKQQQKAKQQKKYQAVDRPTLAISFANSDKPSQSPSFDYKVLKPKVKNKAGFDWVWPTGGRYYRKTGGDKNGLEFTGTFGQRIQSIADGKVVYSGDGLVKYGKLLIVRHNKGYLSAYAHNEKLYVKESERVTAGQHIADMGQSGTNKTKLYFEIRRFGKAVNPMGVLPKQ